MRDTIRMRAMLIYEYDANPDEYPNGMTPEEMAASDAADPDDILAGIVAEGGVLSVSVLPADPTP